MNRHPDIEELGRKIKERDEEAFRTVYKAYFSPLQHYAMRYLYDWNEAENLVQDAFFNLWCHLDRYDAERNIAAYLLTYVKNGCLKYLRSLQIRDNNQDKIIEAILFSNLESEEPDEQLHRRLNEILAQLPERQKEVLIRHIVDQKSIPDIAEEMQIAESSVRTHFKRAMTVLRKNLCFILFGL